MIDLKNGETINGTLEVMDRFMNLKVLNAVITSKDGDQFSKVVELYVKGSSIKNVRMVDGTLERAEKE